MDGKEFRKALVSVVTDARLMDEHRELVLWIEENGRQIGEYLGQLHYVYIDTGHKSEAYNKIVDLRDSLNRLLDNLHYDGCDVRGTESSGEPLVEWEQALLTTTD